MATLTQASHQWATRQPDERFLSLPEMANHAEMIRNRSHASVRTSRTLLANPVDGSNHKGLVVIDRQRDVEMNPTNWAFSQLCQRVEAPAGYLRTLPSEMVADCLNYGFLKKGPEEMGLLALSEIGGENHQLACATGKGYGRVWNADVLNAAIDVFGDGRNGDFRVPGEFGKAVEITKANTTLYAGERNMFIFLADEQHRVDVPNRRNGETGSLARGFFLWNSEVGDCTLGVGAFLFDYVCCNRMVWGAEGYKELRIRHTSGAPDRFISEVAPALEAYRQSSTFDLSTTIRAAQAAKIEEDIDDFLAKRFTKTQAKAIAATHLIEEGRPIETLWDASTGITAYARGVEYQDARVSLEREAGKVLSLAR